MFVQDSSSTQGKHFLRGEELGEKTFLANKEGVGTGCFILLILRLSFPMSVQRLSFFKIFLTQYFALYFAGINKSTFFGNSLGQWAFNEQDLLLKIFFSRRIPLM